MVPELKMQRDYALDYGYIDCRDMARPSACVDFMQDIATLHANELGWSRTVLEQFNAFWALSRLKYTLTRPLKPYEVLHVITWPRYIKGAMWYRDFKFFCGDELVGTATSAWVVVDRDKRHLIRPKALGFTVPHQIWDIEETLGRLRSEVLEPCFDRVIRYSDTDVNSHLNNVKIVDILSDAIGLEEHPELWVSSMQVNFIAETRRGATFSVSKQQEGQEMTIVAYSGGEEKVQASLTLARR